MNEEKTEQGAGESSAVLGSQRRGRDTRLETTGVSPQVKQLAFAMEEPQPKVSRGAEAQTSKKLIKQYFGISYLIDRLRLNISREFASRLIRFSIVGLSGVFVDLGSFYFLHTLLSLTLTASAMISTEMAIINNFLWNDAWTFLDVSSQQNSGIQRLQRFFKFNLICLFGLILNILLVNTLFYQFHVNEYIAKIIAIACVIVWNFGVNLKLNWHLMETEVDTLLNSK